MFTYTEASVERLLRSYLDIRLTLEGNTQNLHDTYTTQHVKREPHRVPFGHTPGSKPWPFMEQRHARTVQDGKAKAKFLEELLCAAIDLEQAFPRLSPDDQKLLMDYHITQNYTLDQIMLERNVTSRGSMQQRIQRAVVRLVRELEHCWQHNHE